MPQQYDLALQWVTAARTKAIEMLEAQGYENKSTMYGATCSVHIIDTFAQGIAKIGIFVRILDVCASTPLKIKHKSLCYPIYITLSGFTISSNLGIEDIVYGTNVQDAFLAHVERAIQAMLVDFNDREFTEQAERVLP